GESPRPGDARDERSDRGGGMTSAPTSYQSPGIATRLSSSKSIPGLLRTLAAQREWGVAILLALTITAVAIVNPDFLSTANLRDVLVNNSFYAIVACGVTFVIVTGEIDISVGSLAGLCAALLGLLTSPQHGNWSPVPAIAVTLLLGLAVGAINGFLVAYARVPSIIVTLGMLSALRSVTKMLMGSEWIGVVPPL